MKITFFPGSVMGYVDYPQALFTRALAQGLVTRDHDVRVVEERKNAFMRRTLETEGSQPARQLYEDFPSIQVHTYEPRTGARLLEWVTQELALIDVAVAVEGLPTEVCRWLANVTRPGLLRVYMAFNPASLTYEEIAEFELDKFDAMIAAGESGVLSGSPVIPLSIARQDEEAGLLHHVPEAQADRVVDPAAAARAFERAVQEINVATIMAQSPLTTPQNGSEPPPDS